LGLENNTIKRKADEGADSRKGTLEVNLIVSKKSRFFFSFGIISIKIPISIN